MSNLQDLYQEMILDHNKKPRNFHVLEDANQISEGYNPLCGDKLKLYIKTDGDVVTDIAFQGAGCAISKSSASMMTVAVKGKTRSEVEALFQKFHDMLSGRGDHESVLGKLAVFSGVCEYPSRVKCATLAWHTLKAGLEHEEEPVSTEDHID